MDILTNHQGEMTPDEKEATHIIYSAVDPLPGSRSAGTRRRDPPVLLSGVVRGFRIRAIADNIPDCPHSPGDIRHRLSVDDLCPPGTRSQEIGQIDSPEAQTFAVAQAKSGKRKSARSSAVFLKKPRADDEDSQDLTKDIDNPPAETNWIEVKACSSNSAFGPATPQPPKREPEMMLLKFATITDLDNADRV